MQRCSAGRGEWARTTVVFSAFLLGAVILAAHLFFLQFNETITNHYIASLQKRWESYEYPRGKRGSILFRDGSILACNRKVARVMVDPALVSDVAGLAGVLAGHTGRYPEDIQATIEGHDGHGAVIADGIPVEAALAIDRENLRGVFTYYDYQRYYPHGSQSAAATVGYAGPEPVHRTGLEYTWNEHLTGHDGRIHFRKDARRKRLPGSEISLDDKQDGEDLRTTLDQAVQMICEDELGRAAGANNCDWGCILVMEPNSGEIRGLATVPSFDPNEYARGNIGNEFNVAVHRVIEPGSTVKPLLAATALENGWLDDQRLFVCNQYLSVDGKQVREAELSHTLGDSCGVPIREIIVHSSNIGMAQVAMALGQDRLLECYRSLGFFRKTGVELPAECSGLSPYYYAERKAGKRVEWPRRVLANAGFGQGMCVTPLQLAKAYCVIANGGYQVNPTLIARDVSPEGDTNGEHTVEPPSGELLLAGIGVGNNPLKQFVPETIHGEARVRVLSEKTCEKVTGWLTEVVNDGTGKKARLSKYHAAGKTGTAQLASDKGGYQKGAYTASFIGFFPAEAPRYVVLVMFVHPRGGKYYGGEVAAPVFKQVCDRISYITEDVGTEALHAS